MVYATVGRVDVEWFEVSVWSFIPCLKVMDRTFHVPSPHLPRGDVQNVPCSIPTYPLDSQRVSGREVAVPTHLSVKVQLAGEVITRKT